MTKIFFLMFVIYFNPNGLERTYDTHMRFDTEEDCAELSIEIMSGRSSVENFAPYRKDGEPFIAQCIKVDPREAVR